MKLDKKEPAPFFDSEGAPQTLDGDHLVLSFPVAAYGNYLLTRSLGLLPKHEGTEFTADELKDIKEKATQIPITRLIDTVNALPREERQQLTARIQDELREATDERVELDDQNPSAPLFMWRDGAVYGVTSDDYMLFNIRSNFTPRSVGKLSPTGCGFSQASAPPAPVETAQQNAMRELKEETKLEISGVDDIGYVMRKPVPQFFELGTDTGKVPGILTGMAYISHHRFEETLEDLVPQMVVGGESFGMIAVKVDQLSELAKGETIPIKFLDSQTDFAQKVVKGAYAQGATTLAEIGAFGTARGKLSKEEASQSAGLRLPAEASDILVNAKDFIGDSNRLATGLHVLREMNVELPQHALDYIEKNSPIDRLLTTKETHIREYDGESDFADAPRGLRHSVERGDWSRGNREPGYGYYDRSP